MTTPFRKTGLAVLGEMPWGHCRLNTFSGSSARCASLEPAGPVPGSCSVRVRIALSQEFSEHDAEMLSPLIDIGLPGIDGYEVGWRIRAGLGSRVLFVALTAHGLEEDRRRSTEASFDAHYPRPGTPGRLSCD